MDADFFKTGGRALFFPWQVRGETSGEREQLGDIERLWQSMGAKITRKEFTGMNLKNKWQIESSFW